MVRAQLFPERTRGLFTVLIEGCWPKRRILEIYLNIAESATALWRRSRRATLSSAKARPLEPRRCRRSGRRAAESGAPFRGGASRYVQQRRDWILGRAGARRSEMLDEIDAYPR